MTRDQFIAAYVLRRCVDMKRPMYVPADERDTEMRALAAQAFDDARLWAEAIPPEFFTAE